MRRILSVAPTVAFVLLWAASAACAQRGGGHASFSGHGGFSGHSAPSFSGGFSAPGSGFHGSASPPGGFRSPSRSGFTSPPGYSSRVPITNQFRNNEFRFSAPQRNSIVGQASAHRFTRTNPGNSFGYSGPGNSSHYRMPYRSAYQGNHDHHHDHGIYFYNFWPGWYGTYGFYGYPNFYQYPPWWAYDDSTEDQGYPTQGAPSQDYVAPFTTEQQPDLYGLQPWPTLYPPEDVPPQTSPAQVTTPPQPADAVTLVFNDGRPHVRIQNYLITSGTVYVMDQQHYEIPVSELDLAATAKVNREAGVKFTLPR